MGNEKSKKVIDDQTDQKAGSDVVRYDKIPSQNSPFKFWLQHHILYEAFPDSPPLSLRKQSISTTPSLVLKGIQCSLLSQHL